MEAHYCLPYDPTGDYCKSLLEDKPNSVHCKMARAISKMLRKDFSRGSAKSLKYGCLPVDDYEILTQQGWKKYGEFCIGDGVLSFNIEKEEHEVVEIEDVFFYKDAEVYKFKALYGDFEVECTEDHKWLAFDGFGCALIEARDFDEYETLVTGRRSIDLFTAELSSKISRITNVFCISTKNKTFVARKVGEASFITGNCTYGATAHRVAKIIGEDLHVGKQVFDKFWEEAEPLKKLLDRLQEYWEIKGKKKYIPGIDGRQIPTRSPHSILNSLFQSAGVICAKRAMVIHHRKLKENKLYLDIFCDIIDGNRSYCQQLIAYHK